MLSNEQLDLNYVNRIINRVAPTLVIVLVIFATIGIIGVMSGARDTVFATHALSLNRTADALEESMESRVRDAIQLSTDNALLSYLDGTLDNEEVAFQKAAELLVTHQGEYLEMRYVQPDGQIALEVVYRNGVAVPTSLHRLGQLPERDVTDHAFQELVSGETRLVTIGSTYRQVSQEGIPFNPPRPVFSVYAPVYLNAESQTPAGVVQLVVVAQELFDIVNQAPDNLLIDELPNRRLLLVNDDRLIVSDSGAVGRAYLNNLEASGGNASLAPEYELSLEAWDEFPDDEITHTEQQFLITRRALNFAGTETVWQLFFVDSIFTVLAPPLITSTVIVLLSVFLSIAAIYGLRWLIRPIVQPLAETGILVERLANETSGADSRVTTETPTLSARPPTRPLVRTAADEQMIGAVGRVAGKIEQLSEALDEQIKRRNRDLQVAGRIGRETATLDDLDTLLKRSINLICLELGFYHAQVFLVDETGTQAVLTASRGEAGQKLIEQGHRINIGSETVIGTVTGERRPVIVNDTRATADPHGFNPLLAETRAEMGLPLIIGDQVIGALDIQSKQTDVFLIDDIPTYQLLADQLAVAVYNAQLKVQSEQRYRQIDRLNKQLIREAWTEMDVELPDRFGTEMPDSPNLKRLSAPISIRGEVIGTLDAALSGSQQFLEGEEVILSAVAERVALAIENARLFEQTQNSLTETSTLYELSRQLNEANTLEDILQAIIIAVAQSASGGQVWIFEDYLPHEGPQWVQLIVDLPIKSRPLPHEMHDALAIDVEPQLLLHVPEHPFFKRLTVNQSLVFNDVARVSNLDVKLAQVFAALQARAVVFIPLNMRGTWKGFITIAFDNPRDFGEREKRIYQALIGQAGVAIDNRLLLQQMEVTLSRNEKLYAASRIINTAQNLQDLVYAAVATTSAPMLDFWLARLEGEIDQSGWPQRSRIVARSNKGSVSEVNEVYPVYVPQNSQMRRRRPDIFVDTDPDNADVSPPIQWMRSFGLRFMAVFGLFSDNVPIALFYIVSQEPYELSQDDMDVYTALTGQMSTQIQNRTLLQRTESMLSETRRLYVASRAIASAENMEAIYEAVAGHLALPLLEATGEEEVPVSISLLLARPEFSINAQELEFAFQWTSNPMHKPEFREGERLAQGQLPFAKLIRRSSEDLLVYRDIAQQLTTLQQETPADYDLLRRVLMQDGATSAVVTPLQSATRWFGVLICRTNQASLLDESYVRFMQEITNRIATSIDRQELLREAERERENLDAILSTLPAGVLVLDPATLVPVRVNAQLEELLRRPIYMDRRFTSADYDLYRTGTNLFYPDDEMPIFAARETGNKQYSEDVAIIIDGQQTELLVEAAPIYQHDGSLMAVVAVFQDISSVRSLENTLQEKLREQVSLYETQRSLSEASTLEDMIESIHVQLVVQQPDEAFVILSDEEDDRLEVVRYMIQPIENVGRLRSILGTELISVPDVETYSEMDNNTRSALKEIGARSVLTTPLRTASRNQTLGWLVVLSNETYAFNSDQERLLTNVADMATTAIDNNYLFERIQRTLRDTASLYNAVNTISRARDLGELQAALEEALQTLVPDMYAGYMFDEEGWHELFKVGFGESEANGLNMHTLLEVPLPQHDALYIADVSRTTLGKVEMEIVQAGNIMGFAAINLRAKDVPGGRLFLGYNQPREFSPAESRLLSAIADSASVVIDNNILLRQIQASLSETTVLYQSSTALNDVTGYNDVVDVISNYLVEPHINQVFLAVLGTPRWDSIGATVEVVASWQSDSDVDLQGVTLSPDQFPAWAQLSSPNVLIINDIYDEELGLDELEKTSIESLDTRSLVIIPLSAANRPIGAIWLGSRQPHNYTDRNLRLFQSFSEQASTTIEANRLLEQTERRARQLVTSAEISQRIGRLLDLDTLLSEVVDLIQESFNYDHVQVFLMDEDDDWALLRASTGEAGRQLLGINHKLRKGSESVIGRVTATGEATIALDTADANVVHQPNSYLPLTRSEMALPLIVEGKVVGALDVQSNQPNFFGDDDVQAVRTLAAQVSVAIVNARLFLQTQRSANEMSFLFELTTQAAAAETVESAMQQIADRLLEAQDALTVAMYLPQIYADFRENTLITLRAVALAGTQQPISGLNEIQVDDDNNLVAVVAEALVPQILRDVRDDSRYLSIEARARSAIIVPISSAGQLIGIITMESRRVAAFNQDTLQLLQTLAGSVAAIIQNTRLVEELQLTNEQLRELDRVKSQFLASMSHELRTPLNSIIGFSRVMLKGIDGPLTEMQEQDLTTIYNSGNHLLELINGILDQAKIANNELNLKFGYFDMKPLIEGVRSIGIGNIKQYDKENNLKLFVDIEPDIPRAYGDEFRTRQILINLLSNAIKFTPEGEVRVRAYKVEIEGTTYVRVDVQDTGIGIDEKDMPLLFEEFRQVDSSLTRTVGGTGLGLPISRSLAELQGGTLNVASEPNVGSTFWVLIPTEPTVDLDTIGDDTRFDVEVEVQDNGGGNRQKPKTTPPQKPVSKRQTGSLSGNDDADDSLDEAKSSPFVTQVVRTTQPLRTPQKRDVLLIEDNKDMVDQYRRILQREGFQVQTADHPAYARAMVEQMRPSVVLLDVHFGNGEGWSILEDLKEKDSTFDIPIVVSTLDSDSERAYRSGAYAFLQRPIVPEELVGAILEAEQESSRERILIIDDQPDAIRLLAQLLGEHGNYRVFWAENGNDGITMVARRQPDLIILDLRMPEMDGFDVLQRLRENPETANIPVMVVTGDVNLKDSEQEQLQNIRVLPKSDIGQQAYDQFIHDVKQHLQERSGTNN